MLFDATSSKNTKLIIIGFFIFFTAFLFRASLVLISYGGGDATNGASFVEFYNSGYDIYSNISPWPYLPFANSVFWIWELVSDILEISVNSSYRLFSSFFDSLIALLIYFYLIFSSSKAPVKLSLIYVFNPITIIITSTLGFTDSFALFFLILTVIASDFRFKFKFFFIAFFLAVSISCKPIALIFAPFFFYKSENKFLFIIILLISILLLNSYYFFGASLSQNIELLKLVLEKLITGTQSGKLGVGSFIHLIGMGWAKLITVFGLLVLGIIYILRINAKSSDFILIIFTALLFFRYNFHPQYMAWIVPFILLTNRNIFPYLAIGGLSIIVIISTWNDSSGAFSLLNAFDLDRANLESYFVKFYQYLDSPLFLGLIFLFSILIIHEKKFISSLIDDLKIIFLMFPRISIKDFSLIFFISLLMGYLFLSTILIGEGFKAGIMLRSLFLISLPSFILLYLILKFEKNFKYRLFALIVFIYLLNILLSYYLVINNFNKSYNTSFAYFLLLVPLSIVILYRRSKLFSMLLLNSKQQIIKQKLISNRFFVLAFILCLILLLIPWSNLFKSAKNQFVFDKSIKQEEIYKIYDEVNFNSPLSAFKYGNNYAYKLSLDTNQYFDFDELKQVELSLLSDSYFAIRINGVEVLFSYSPLYYMRHSTQRKYYAYGIKNIDLTNYLHKGVNEVVIYNNISSPVSPVGILPILFVKTINNKLLKFNLSSSEWSINKAHLRNGVFNSKDKIGLKKLSTIDIVNNKFELDKTDLPNFLDNSSYFMAPKNLSIKDKSLLAPVDVFLIMYLVLMIIIFVLTFKVKNEK